MPEILHQFSIKASPAQVYQAITEQDRLAKWWTSDVQAKAMIGAQNAFTFDNGRVTIRVEVSKLTPNSSIEWRCLGGLPEWEGTEISFDLEQNDSQTTVRFTHRGWERPNGILALCSFEWARYLMSLRAYLENGEGSPAKG